MLYTPSLKKRVLILDDDQDLSELLTDFLGSVGFNIKTIEKGGDLFKTVASFDPHLVILDFLLDGINGGELCHQLKTSCETRHIPVILFSAYPKVLLSLGTYGCDEFIAKPFDLDPFVRKITQLITISNPVTKPRHYHLQRRF